MVSRIVNTMALAAALVALSTCLWQEWGLFITLKRVILSYLGFFFLGSVMAIIVKAVPFLDNSEKVSPGIPEKPTTKIGN